MTIGGSMLKNLLIIGAGGSIGAVSRYIAFLAFDRFYHKTGFPIGTLAVNLIGSLIIGITFGLSVKFNIFSRHAVSHMLFVTGFLGSFTTFSTFSQDNLILLLDKNYGLFALNICTSVIAGILLAAAGYFAVTAAVQ